ncbi:MAG: radical SAM protein, partial [Phycisphaerales bacterium]
KIGRYSPVGSLVLTIGCKFACPYCPVPAYNQRKHRFKSGERIADEMGRLYQEYGIRYFFGTDDNFFSQKERALEIVETLARAEIGGARLRRRVRWGTEVTVHDTLQFKDYMRDVSNAGIRALWLGVEDMTATLIKKGQSVDKTREAFDLLHKHHIAPMPMMMHHDTQPLYTRKGDYGLLNQVRLLRKARAISLQVLMITPATGSKLYEECFTSGMVYETVGGRQVEPRMFDGNHVVASRHEKPWRKQLNVLAAYMYFYNPLRFLYALVRPKSKLYLADAVMQLTGMWGVGLTVRRTLGWLLRLRFGRITRRSQAPGAVIPMRAPGGGPASHALPGTPQGGYVSVGIKAKAYVSP